MNSKSNTNNDGVITNGSMNNEDNLTQNDAPLVPLWQTWGLRIFFAGLVFVIGKWQLMSILQGPFEWTAWRGVGHSLLFTLALLAIGGMFRPLAFLPIMLFEIVWKVVWLTAVALPLWMAGEEIPGVVSVKGSLIGVGLIIICTPWKYVWWRYFKQAIEPWRRKK
ncbi:MAG: hypothetical protein ABNH31_12685 [Glaciecola sp.]